MKVGFSRPKGFSIFGTLVRLWQGWTPYSHTYFRFYSSEFQTRMVLEASYGSVHLITWDRFVERHEVIEEFLVYPDNREEIITKIAPHLQKPYGFIAILQIPLRRLGFRFKGDGMHSFICSELTAYVLGDNIPNKDRDYITPKDLYEHLKAQCDQEGCYVRSST